MIIVSWREVGKRDPKKTEGTSLTWSKDLNVFKVYDDNVKGVLYIKDPAWLEVKFDKNLTTFSPA